MALVEGSVNSSKPKSPDNETKPAIFRVMEPSIISTFWAPISLKFKETGPLGVEMVSGKPWMVVGSMPRVFTTTFMLPAVSEMPSESVSVALVPVAIKA